MAAINYGKTIAYPTGVGDVLPDLRPVEGITALKESLFRRFETDEGTVPWDRGGGCNLRNFILDNGVDVYAVKKRVEAECRKDDRVDSASARVIWNKRTKTLKIEVQGTGALGPFDLSVSTDGLTLELLRN